MIFRKAYQAYQQQNYDQCLKLLQELKPNDTQRLDLQAQVHFQKREFQKAYDIYQALIDKGGENVQERKENVQVIIVCAQLEQPGLLKTKPRDKVPSTQEIVDQVQQINLKDESVYDMFAKRRPAIKRKKLKRKIRLPKQYDPNVPPNPDRWLPKRARKGQAHKQKKRRQRPNQRGKSRAK